MADSHWLSPKKVPPGPLHPSGWRGPLFFLAAKEADLKMASVCFL